MLQTSSVHRHLDKRPKILGMDATDLILLMLLSSIMNWLLGDTSLSFAASFVLPALLGAVLFIAKRGRPDGFLLHLIRYYSSARSVQRWGGDISRSAA